MGPEEWSTRRVTKQSQEMGQMWGLRGREVEFGFYFKHNGKSREGFEAQG